MKKCIAVISAFILCSIVLTSCGNSVKSDAKEMADKTCKATKLMQKVFAGDKNAAKELQTLTKETEELGNKIKGKYTSEKDQKAFQNEYIKDLQNCK
ncbi:MAG: hypothetical protein P4L28_00240 [Paludibacteraceae bacterium]|nr:hypothetical protein [Paludibacteraceae bacterium]